jgi:hypothetical protein
MLMAQLHFDDGTMVEQPIGDGQTVPFRLQHVHDLNEDTKVHTFAYRAGQPTGELIIHYDELVPKPKIVH